MQDKPLQTLFDNHGREQFENVRGFLFSIVEFSQARSDRLMVERINTELQIILKCIIFIIS